MKLTDDMAHYPFPGLPTAAFQPENCGPIGMVLAAQDLIRGLTVVFALCKFDDGEWTVKEIIRMAVPEGLRVVRYMGEGGPMGAGSHAVHGSGSVDTKGEYDYDDVPLLTACVCMAVIRTGHMSVRVKEDI